MSHTIQFNQSDDWWRHMTPIDAILTSPERQNIEKRDIWDTSWCRKARAIFLFFLLLYYYYYYYFFFFFFLALSTTFLRALILWQCDKIKFHGVTPACQSRDLACTCRQRFPSAMLWTISGTESLCRVYRQSHQRSCCPDHSKIPNHQCTRRQRPRKPTAQICNCGTSRHIWQFSWQQLAIIIFFYTPGPARGDIKNDKISVK